MMLWLIVLTLFLENIACVVSDGASSSFSLRHRLRHGDHEKHNDDHYRHHHHDLNTKVVTTPIITTPDTATFAATTDISIPVIDVDATYNGTFQFFFSQVWNDERYFTIHSETGVIHFLASPNFDLPEDDDRNNIYQIFVIAMDLSQPIQFSDYNRQLISITVTEFTSSPTTPSPVTVAPVVTPSPVTASPVTTPMTNSIDNDDSNNGGTRGDGFLSRIVESVLATIVLCF